MISGRYRLEAEIGAGGMAHVWRARDLTLDRPVAVKFLFLREDRDQQRMIERFLREARIAASVRHPNVVDVLDFGTTPSNGRPFMVMELLVGESLDDRLGAEPTPSVQSLVQVLSEVLEGLAAVHKAGIVHRDLKPDNIFLLDDDGGGVRPKLLDFGVSRDTDPNSGRRSALTTNAGYLVGTPEYMSPEQARGLKDIDWRTDIYSIGVVLYEALTGRLPYDAEAVGDLIIEIVGGEAPAVFELRPEVGEPISTAIAKAMASAREDRFQSAKALREALLDAVARTDLSGVHTLVPARKRAAVVPSVGGLDSLDGSLAWGAGAVPSFGAAQTETLAEPADPERSATWTIETELPARRRSRTGLLAAGVLAAGLVGGGASWVALGAGSEAPGPQDIAAPVASPAEADPPEGPSEERGREPSPERAPAEPTAAPAELVTVTLTGLPANAHAFVDDEPAPLEAGTLSLPRDDRAHEIRVEAPRRRPWTTTHLAVDDGSYRVRLRRRSSATARRSRTGSGVFRDLDY